MTRILIVDDDDDLRDNLFEILDDAGYATEVSVSASDAIETNRKGDFDVILLDFMMPGTNGLDALGTIRKRYPNAKIIMMTAFATVEHAVDAIRKGAADYICKPFKINDLLTVIRRVLEESRFEKNINGVGLDRTLNLISSRIRRNILNLLSSKGPMRLMDMTRELDIADHTKVVFHLKLLKEGGIIEQNETKLHSLTRPGRQIVECLKNMESVLSGSSR
jgi:DNA-binding response OmpR family regulator